MYLASTFKGLFLFVKENYGHQQGFDIRYLQTVIRQFWAHAETTL